MRWGLLVVAAVVACSCSQPSPVAAKPTPTGPISLSGTIGKAGYVIDVPASWNGTLFLFSHGYVAPGSANPAQDAPVAQARDWLLAHHYAMAGSSYSSTGWALQDAFKDQVALLDYFGAHVAKPKRVIAWGVSLGGIITAGLLQLYPGRFAAAMPLCGVLAGGVATWNTELDAAYAFKTLFAPGSGLQIVHITNGPNNLRQAESLFNIASQTAKGRARLSLIAALTDLPGWFDPIKPEPPSTDFAARVAAQEMWESRVDFPFAFEYRTDLEMRAGGNPSWNVGVDYARQLAGSPDAAEVAALYHAAGLSLTSDLGALNAGSRIAPDAGAAAYLQRNVSFDGRLTVPVLTIHTTGDGLVIPPNESAYAQVVSSAGDGDLLRQLFVHRAGHCAFTPAEVIAGLQVLLSRLDTGKWNDAALQPAALNVAAVAQGASLNGFFGFSEPPAFVAYQAAPYPRPFSAGSAIPA